MGPIRHTANNLDTASSVIGLRIMMGVFFMVRTVPALFVPSAFGFPFFEMRVTRDGLVRCGFGLVGQGKPGEASR